jgi:acyl-coenzyme A synthetase/AMP-(fatty) acid ligase
VKIREEKPPTAVPLSRFTPASRDKDTVLCYSGAYSGGKYQTWGDFLAGTAALRNLLQQEHELRWILHCNDYWHFLLAYTALLQCGRHVLLTANISPAYLAEISAEGETALITDEKSALPLVKKSLYVPDLIRGPLRIPESAPPAINAEETVIVLYTSGTTGQPKQVRQRLTEFENDNGFILSSWGGECQKRKLCSSVSPHHIYGLLFSVMLPFTAGIPFRRERIEFPETFETLQDDSYLIITVPALLKRSVEGRENAFALKEPWIFSSGGVLPPETAARTESLFGIRPLEIYGSTETSGIAWRSKPGPEWTLFDNAEISKNEEGCLVIKSPYIRDPAGFTTGDLVELLDDGRFILNGRADSIVKIEEKRISLPEVENRLMQSGLVSDAAVIAMQGKRQYLAAALVLNGKGKEQFGAAEKFRVNRWFREYLLRYFENMVIPKRWRYPETLPRSAQGKVQKQDIEALFPDRPLLVHFPQDISGIVIEQSENSGVFELTIPGKSPYFDDHFPGFKLLPAVAQVELVLFCAGRILGPVSLRSAKRIKFSNAILPDTKVRIKIEYSQGMLRFSVYAPPAGAAYSSGIFRLEDGQ